MNHVLIFYTQIQGQEGHSIGLCFVFEAPTLKRYTDIK